MLGMLKRRWKPRRSPRRGARSEVEPEGEAPPPHGDTAVPTPNLRVASGRIEFVSPPPGRVACGQQTDPDPAYVQLAAQNALVAKLQRQVARGQEERELRVRAEAARAQADHAKLAALGRALRKEKLRSQVHAQQAAASAATAEARWLQTQAAMRRLTEENVSLRAQLEHCCSTSEALCAGLTRARSENEALVAEATRCERCLEDVARGVMAALIAQARLRARIGALGKPDRPMASQRDSLTWDTADSSAGDGDACADSPCAADTCAADFCAADFCAAEFCAGAGDDGYSTMSPDLPRALAAPGQLPALHEEPAARARHSFPPAARPRPLAARSLAAQPTGAGRWPLGGWGALSDWSMSSEERLSGSGSSDWSCQPGVDFTRDFYRLVRFGSSRSLASRAGNVWPMAASDALGQPIASRDSLGLVDAMAIFRGAESPFGFYGNDEQYLQLDGPYLQELGPCCQGNGTCCQGDEACCQGDKPCCEGDKPCCQGDKLCLQGDKLCCQGDKLCCQGNEACRQGDEACRQGDEVCRQGDGPCLEQEDAFVPGEGDAPSCLEADSSPEESLRFCSERSENLPFREQQAEHPEDLGQACSVVSLGEEQRCQLSQDAQREGSSDSDLQEDQADSRADVYQRLHRLHKVRRHRKADAARAQRLRAAPARASILERAVFTRFGPAEQAAMARFDFLSCHDDPPPGCHDDQQAEPAEPSDRSSSSSSESSGSSSQWEYVALADNQWETLGDSADQWEEAGKPVEQWQLVGSLGSQWDRGARSGDQCDEPGGSRSQWARVESSEESSEEATQQLSLSDSC